MSWQHVRISRFGGPEVLELAEEATIPNPGTGEVRIKVLAAGTAPMARHQGGSPMRLSSAIRAALITLTVAVGFGTSVYADGGRIRFNVVKAGFVIGGSGGSGTLLFHGRYYPLAIGGVSYGFTFGASATDFFGTVSNIRWPSDVNGVYVAAGAGAAVGPGGGAILLTNQNGALLTVSGRQVGLIVAADLNGLVITIR